MSSTQPKRILILSDIHEKFAKWQRIIQTYGGTVDQIICMGDYFDSFNHTEVNARLMAQYIRENIDNPFYRWGLGNHDTHYLWDDRVFSCSGYHADTKAIVTHTLRDVRDKFKLVHWIADDQMLSHAGLTKGWLGRFGLTPGHNAELRKCTEHLEFLWQNGGRDEKYMGVTPLQLVSTVGQCRGGYEKFGGITWCDFRHEFQHIPGLTQVMGHTRMKDAPKFTEVDDNGNQSIMLDSDFNHVMIATWEETRYRLQWEEFPSIPSDNADDGR